MAEKIPQTYENHRRFIPLYHFGVFGLFATHSLYSLWRLWKWPHTESVMAVLIDVALILLFFYTRIFALTAQDRIIRLEERLRLLGLLPADLRPRLEELSPAQLVGLRFASDEEFPALARKVLDEKITDREAIKKLIKHWRADYLRV